RGRADLRPARRGRPRPGDRDRNDGPNPGTGRRGPSPGDGTARRRPRRAWRIREPGGRGRMVDVPRPPQRTRAATRRGDRPPGRPRLRRRAAPRDARGPLPPAAQGAGPVTQVLTIARLTILEASRRKLLLA